MKRRTSFKGMVLEFPFPFPFGCLYDFNVDDSSLKSSHKEWLDKNVVKFLKSQDNKGQKWYIHIIGTASRTADDEYNLELSGWRAISAEDYLKPKLQGVTVEIKLTGNGERWAAQRGEEDNTEFAIDRAVWVIVSRDSKPPPPPPPPRRKPDYKKDKAFKIMLKKGWIVSVQPMPVLAKVKIKLIFTIWDLEENTKKDYIYDGFGDSAGWSKLPVDGSFFDPGPWNDFTASRSVSINDFKGFAWFNSTGMTPGPSIYLFAFCQKNKWLPFPSPRYVIKNFQTGPQLGTPSVGRMETSGIFDLAEGQN